MKLPDGKIRVTNQKGKESHKFDVKDYTKYITERVEEWSYMKYPYLNDIGWDGFTDGEKSGIYRVGPLGRLNGSEGMATPLAEKEYKRLYKTLGGKPVNSTLAYHWARLIELLYATERAKELIDDSKITSEDIRNPVGDPGEGFGVTEAARGTLIHHYKLDKKGLVEKANLIVATTNNAGAITMSVRDAAKGIISKGKIDDTILNKVEMAFRAYDPCFACATHTLPGGMALQVDIYNHQKKIIRTLKQ